MSKKFIFIILIIIFDIILIGNINYPKASSIPTYDGDIICKKDKKDVLEDDIKNSSSIIYIKLDGDMVVNAVYQSISDGDYYEESLIQMIQSYLNLYQGLDGIDTNVDYIDSKIITTVTYDYRMIDVSKVRYKLNNILASDSIFIKEDTLPISYELFSKYELKGYSCN
jgi:hypothetical protein